MSGENKLIVIGLGPHCKRIYINTLHRLNQRIELLIELHSKRNHVLEFIKNTGLSCEVFFIPDEERDVENFSTETSRHLTQIFQRLKISHAIISTEPKAHFAFLNLLIKEKIKVLIDKPVIAPLNVINSESQALQIKKQYLHLLQLAEQNKVSVTVQCQRRYDRRYKAIRDLINNTTRLYNVPITNIQIYHSDGAFNMPDEFWSRENHPYKYGYGKLFHSGYHFLDLLSQFLEFDGISDNKIPDACTLSTAHYDPDDQLLTLNQDFYKKIFPHKNYSEEFKKWEQGEYALLGELDFSGLLEFTKNQKTITTATFNLIQSGFSRRSWPELPVDTYKGNGRIRHESICLHMGPLMSIQIHSYQSREVKDREKEGASQTLPGGLEHFDVFIFRNNGLIGGKPFECIKGSDLFPPEVLHDPSFIGYNELSRDTCLKEFLYSDKSESGLFEQSFTIDLITHAYLSMANNRKGHSAPLNFSILLKNKRNDSLQAQKFNQRLPFDNNLPYYSMHQKTPATAPQIAHTAWQYNQFKRASKNIFTAVAAASMMSLSLLGYQTFLTQQQEKVKAPREELTNVTPRAWWRKF